MYNTPMATADPVAHELNKADLRLLDLLSDGRITPSYAVERTGYTRQYVHQRLQLLKAAGMVENLGHGLYELSQTDDSEPQAVESDDGKISVGRECPWCGEEVNDPADALTHLDLCPPDDD